MEWILENTIDALSGFLSSALDLIGNCVITILCMNVGSGTSFFEIVFGSIGIMYRVFVIMGMVLLCLNLLWQLVRAMTTPESQETAAALIVRTIIVGILLSYSKSIIYIMEDFFSNFYTFLLTVKLDGNNTVLTSGFTDFADQASATLADQAAATGALVLTFILLVMIGYQFVMYTLECVERYILIGIMMYLSPLAISMAGSRSTSSITSNFVRMVASQYFLMICNVFFMRLFFLGFSNYDSIIADLNTVYGSSHNSASLTVVWAFILIGILTIGQKVDTYLGTLGLSAAQTGRGLGAAIVSSGLAIRRALGTASDIGRGVGASVSKGVNNYKDHHQSAAMKPDNTMTESTQKAFAGGNLKKDDVDFLDGVKLGNTVQRNVDMPSGFAAKLDPTSAKHTDIPGGFQMKTRPDENGEKTTLTATPMDQLENTDLSNVQGKVGTFGGKDYFFQASGAEAEKFYANGAMDHSMKEFNQEDGQSASRIPGTTGAYETRIDGQDIATQFYPANLYQQDRAMGSTMTNVNENGFGGEAFHQVTLPLDSSGNVISSIPIATASQMMSPDPVAAVNAFESVFPDMAGTGVSNVHLDAKSGFISYSQNGRDYVMASAYQYSIENAYQGEVSVHTASNKAVYASVDAHGQHSGTAAFIPRGGSFSLQMKEDVMLEPKKNLFGNNSIYKTASDRSSKK